MGGKQSEVMYIQYSVVCISKKFTAGVLTELNRVYEVEASTSFTDALVRTNTSGLEKKKCLNFIRLRSNHLQKNQNLILQTSPM